MTNKPAVSEYHRIISPLVGLALCVALMPSMKGVAHTTTAAPQTTTIADQFAGEALSVSDSSRAGRIQIYISQWSSDAEVQRLREPFERADAGSLLSMLHDQHRRAGVVLMPGIQAHGTRSRTPIPRNLLFARQIMTPSGRQIIAIADEHLGLGEPPLEAHKDVQEFNLLDIRFGLDGNGVGKIVSSADIAFSAKTGMIEVKDFSNHPSRLIDVRAQKP
jgi:hypothetical protein